QTSEGLRRRSPRAGSSSGGDDGGCGRGLRRGRVPVADAGSVGIRTNTQADTCALFRRLAPDPLLGLDAVGEPGDGETFPGTSDPRHFVPSVAWDHEGATLRLQSAEVVHP